VSLKQQLPSYLRARIESLSDFYDSVPEFTDLYHLIMVISGDLFLFFRCSRVTNRGAFAGDLYEDAAGVLREVSAPFRRVLQDRVSGGGQVRGVPAGAAVPCGLLRGRHEARDGVFSVLFWAFSMMMMCVWGEGAGAIHFLLDVSFSGGHDPEQRGGNGAGGGLLGVF
jgi:hypothetical protein